MHAGSVADQLHHIQQIKSSSDAFVALRDDAQLICGPVLSVWDPRENYGEPEKYRWKT